MTSHSISKHQYIHVYDTIDFNYIITSRANAFSGSDVRSDDNLANVVFGNTDHQHVCVCLYPHTPP